MTKEAAVNQTKRTGQSLVEVALFLPILVILLAGIVELSQLVITQNRISNAARTATRFGANGGEDDGIVRVALNTITQTLDARPDRWDIWVIRGQIDPTGSYILDSYTFDHAYGISNTQLFSTVVAADIKDDILTELKKDEQGAVISGANNLREKLGDVRFIGTYILHDVDSILGLDAFPALATFSSVRALTVMRVTGINLEPTKGCNAFPIGVNEVDFRSLTEPGSGSNPFPDASAFTYPNPAPKYGSFVNHQDDSPLRSAQEGYLFKLDANRMRWLVWNTIHVANDATTLNHSLAWPGDSTDYPTYGFYEPDDPTDQSLIIGDYVAISAATTASVNNV
ncbi:MAG: pilus assembly protein, partial [Anaerolineae bacterium]